MYATANSYSEFRSVRETGEGGVAQRRERDRRKRLATDCIPVRPTVRKAPPNVRQWYKTMTKTRCVLANALGANSCVSTAARVARQFRASFSFSRVLRAISGRIGIPRPWFDTFPTSARLKDDLQNYMAGRATFVIRGLEKTIDLDTYEKHTIIKIKHHLC